MDAIAYDQERTFVFLLDEESSTVRRVEVQASSVSSGASSVMAINSVDPSLSLVGRKYVSRGAHYLVDGEQVRPIEVGDGQ